MPLSSRFAGSSLGPEKKEGRGAATSLVPCRPFHRALLQEGKPGQARHHGPPPPMARASQKRTRHRCLNPHHPRGKPRQASRAPRRLHSTAGHRDRPPLSARFAGSSLRPEKKKGRGTATSPIPMQSLHRALRHHGSRGKLDTPPAVRIRLTPSKREGKAPPPRPCHPRALGGQGGSRGRLDPSLPPPPPPGRLPRFAGSSLGPEKKDEAPPPRPSPSPGPQEPAAATAGWTLAGISAPVCTSTHLCHHRAFRGRGRGCLLYTSDAADE